MYLLANVNITACRPVRNRHNNNISVITEVAEILSTRIVFEIQVMSNILAGSKSNNSWKILTEFFRQLIPNKKTKRAVIILVQLKRQRSKSLPRQPKSFSQGNEKVISYQSKPII